ncbi:MAG: hypothetical protein KKB50_15615 [Planctomycetes bacterium]|nr:hypothetical protein [Planctomycetota bacterium]
MSRKDASLSIIAVAVLAGAGGVFWNTSRTSERKGNIDFPDGHPYMCNDCQHVTVLTDKELFRIKNAARESGSLEPARIPCEACGSKNTTLALRCPNCGNCFLRTAPGRPVCPHCNKPFPLPSGDK